MNAGSVHCRERRGVPAAGVHSFDVYNRRAFTLTELLIVLGIVGLLIGLLLPAVNAVRQMAWQVRCASNLRQMGVALGSYTLRGSHTLPYAAIFNVTAGSTLEGYGPDAFMMTWDDLLRPDLGPTPSDVDLMATLCPLSLPVYVCPSDTVPRFFTVPHHRLSYAIVTVTQ